ncbi:DUF5906 domain-containing protein [Vannielia sp. SX4]|uniref:DUF5906 domain-containing protein n=1 Tax=Vannielia sp. SX4 TaxID=3463852 RepID=UPI00405A37AF
MEFQDLFEGNQDRFLTYTTTGARRDDGKLVAKYRTVQEHVTDDLWQCHLDGKQSLGLSPLRDGKVKWGAVDVDYYPLELSDDDLRDLLREWRDPCLISRSKSGGIHIIAFADDWVDADMMRKYLTAKRDAVLRAELIDHAQEIFPKQDDGDGSQMNLPSFGTERAPLFYSYPGLQGVVGDDMPWHEIGRVSEGDMAKAILSAMTPKPKKRGRPTRERKSGGGFARPTEGYGMQGRNNYLYACGASTRARGADNDQVEEIIRVVNEEFASEDSELGHKGPITDERRLNTVIQQVKKLKQEPVLDISYDTVARMNEDWAILVVDGKLKFLQVCTGMCFSRADFQTYTQPLTTMVNGKRVPIAPLWIADPDRAEYSGIVIEAPDYDGPGFNIFEGWAVQPRASDASLWVDYVERILCGGDKDLAHWVMSWIADGVQRPWSLHPGTAIALRGRQGGGKSFLGKMIARLLKPAQTQEIEDSGRMFERFNRRLFGSTFVFAEESVFTESRQQANQLKVFITSNLWTYEQKHLATFSGKNVHRLIATTNDEQAVHLDDDDRRWTVIEVETMFDDMTSEEARAAWQPYYEIDPSVVLGYLLQYAVDHDLIARPHITHAKREAKIASDPVLEVLHNIAMAGVVPDNTRDNGVIASAVLHREARKLGASPYDKPVVLANRAKKMLGLGSEATVRNAKHITDLHRTVDGDGAPMIHPVFGNGGQARGFDLGPLSEFRAKLARITGATYPDGGWEPYGVPQPNDDGEPRASAADVERMYEERYMRKHGEASPF